MRQYLAISTEKTPQTMSVFSTLASHGGILRHIRKVEKQDLQSISSSNAPSKNIGLKYQLMELSLLDQSRDKP